MARLTPLVRAGNGLRGGFGSAIEVTALPEDFTGAINDTASFAVTATGTALTYQWQYYNAGVWQDYNIATANESTFSFKITNTRLNYKYRCVVKDVNGNTVITNTVNLIEA